MEKIIEQIKKIEGVKTVELIQKEVLVVTFEAEKTLSVDELKYGEIYFQRTYKKGGLIGRFNKNIECSIHFTTGLDTNGFYYKNVLYNKIFYRNSYGIIPATIEQKRTLIRAEIENGYFHELR